MTGIRIEILEKTYRVAGRPRRAILRDLRFELRPGEFACLVGPSGCGKTTLLNIIAGLDADYTGTLRIEGAKQPPRIGYVFQQPRLLPWRTVRENIDLALPPGSDRAYVRHLFEVVGLTESLDAYPERLSLGMSRRAALVRAFALNPDLLLLDEPFVSLDPPTARRVRGLLLRLWRERPHTVLFVTHDLHEAIELADRLIFLAGAPASIVGDIAIDLPRTQRDEPAILGFRQHLHERCPSLHPLL